MLLRRSKDQMLTDSLDQLLATGNITHIASGGVARSLVDIGVDRVSELMDALEFNLNQSRLSRASGYFLDIIGESRGIRRGGSSRGTIDAAERSLRFYTPNGTALATHLPSKTIPVDTVVRNASGTITFSLSDNALFSDTDTEIFASAISSGTGTSQNIGKGLLSTHSLGVGTIAVTNVFPVSNASDSEDDDSYRFRLTRSIFSAASANKEALRVAAFGAGDVSDVQIRPLIQGAGTFEIFLIPRGNKVSRATIRQVQFLVDLVAPMGSLAIVRSPTSLPVEISIELIFTQETPEGEKGTVKRGARQALLDYLSVIPVGGLFVYNEMVQRVMDVSTRILDMRTICYSFRREPQVLGNIRAYDDESFVPDEEMANPIKVM